MQAYRYYVVRVVVRASGIGSGGLSIAVLPFLVIDFQEPLSGYF